MSLYSTANKVIYSGNGATTVWPFAFPVLDAAHLSVIRTDGAGVETVLASSLYAVGGIGDPAGGSVTYPLAGAALASGNKLTLLRSVPYVQGTVLSNQGGYYPEVVESSLDRIYMALQQHEEKLDRSLVGAASDADATLVLPAAAARAGKVPAFDGDGNLVVSNLTLEQIEEQTAADDAIAAAASAASAASQAATATGAAATASSAASSAASDAAAAAASAAAAAGQAGAPQGRLTLSSGVPVMTSSVSAAGTVYFTPYNGNRVPLWNGSSFQSVAFTELANVLADSSTGKAGPAAAGANQNIDLFVWNDGGTVRLTRGPAWASDAARGTGTGSTELDRTQGWLVNKHSIDHGPPAGYGTYVGTIRTNGTGQIDLHFGGANTPAMISVWNAQNRARICGAVYISGSWAYTTGAWRMTNNSTANRFSAVCGIQESGLSIVQRSQASTSGSPTGVFAGIGKNSTTTPSGSWGDTIIIAIGGSGGTNSGGALSHEMPVGFNYWQGLEYGAPSVTFWGAAIIYDGSF